MGPTRGGLAESPPKSAPPVGTSRSALGRMSPRSWSWPVWALLVVAVVVIVAGALVWRAVASGPPALTRADVARTVQQGITSAEAQQRKAPADGVTVYRTILPSLVTVTTQNGSLGAGVVVNSDGTVLTALHVVADGTPVTIEFQDGTKSPASIARRRPDTDIAVLAIQRAPGLIVPAVLGGGAQIGSAVFSAGNPLGLRGTLTAGVVSGLDRTTAVNGGQALHGLIQFDAAVNPGNSGGPLLNRDGQVIGIVTGLANPSNQPYFIGIGFAVPIQTAGGAAGSPQK